MSTRTIVIGVIILFLLLVGGIFWFYSSQRQNVPGTTTGGIFNFFPFGQGPTTTNTPPGTTSTSTENTQGSAVSSQLHQISTAPVAGATSFSQSGRDIVRYTERSTGHTYDAFVDTVGVVRMSNTTIPKVSEALWSPATSSLIVRYLDSGENITTYAATLLKQGEEGQLSGIFLPRNILNITFSPNGSSLAYLTDTASGAEVITAKADGSKKTSIFTSPLHEWLLSWPATATLMLQSKPSASAEGFLYSLGINGKVKKVLGNILGLIASVNSAFSKIVFSESAENGLAMRVLDMKSGTTLQLPLSTLPRDKCVWSTRSTTIIFCAAPRQLPAAAYPDAWYQGLISFSDDIWKIDTVSGN